MRFYFFLLLPIFCSSQINYFENLSKITVGIHSTNYYDSWSVNQSPYYKAGLITFSSQSVFIDYRIFSLENHSLKTGIFLNRFNKNVTYIGNIYDIYNEQYVQIDNNLPNLREVADKTFNTELYLNYNYNLIIYKKLRAQVGGGLSYVHNQPPDFVDYTHKIRNMDSEFIYEQIAGYLIFNEERIKWRYQVEASLGYENSIGLFNLGLKYSLPIKNKEAIIGNMSFFDPGPNGENTEYLSFIRNSGKYLSFYLSFTPKKNLFKKKK